MLKCRSAPSAYLRGAITAYAKRAGLELVGEYYDAAVSGADPVDTRPGFTDLLARAEAEEVRVILVEAASRFARDLIIQEAGHAMLGVPSRMWWKWLVA